MNKKLREQVYNKYNGLCAYTGKPLGQDWQVDHVIPKSHYVWYQPSTTTTCDDIENLVPAIKIINHYKRGLDLEGFRRYMLKFHTRVSKLPKNTRVERTKKRKEYMQTLADLFEISVDRPFTGVFYFETLKDII